LTRFAAQRASGGAAESMTPMLTRGGPKDSLTLTASSHGRDTANLVLFDLSMENRQSLELIGGIADVPPTRRSGCAT
jgi:hypothetical protein